MWKSVTSCGKQLTIHSKVRELADNYEALYEIAEIEFDQYKLKLLERNKVPPAEEVEVKLSCAKIIQYKFEVEEKNVSSKNI